MMEFAPGFHHQFLRSQAKPKHYDSLNDLLKKKAEDKQAIVDRIEKEKEERNEYMRKYREDQRQEKQNKKQKLSEYRTQLDLQRESQKALVTAKSYLTMTEQERNMNQEAIKAFTTYSPAAKFKQTPILAVKVESADKKGSKRLEHLCAGFD